ncbi:EthD domain-containing protein [Ideonella livida]|uniref:EthD domain-containing protein n=1 Tax=Ideonella livida TaxID=2707176 RepID=A0A7C9PKS1_9BURK|nr:EthD domain-containing protein [Ideonella livida]NDY93891.1 EthD domain-containing protein [Ideonella livida]
MIQMLAAICRRPGMTHAEFIAYIQHRHAALSREQPVRLRRYVQHHVLDAAYGRLGEPTHPPAQVLARDSVTELTWDHAADMVATFQHEHVRTRVGPDGALFADMSRSLSLVAEPLEQPVPHPGWGGAKVLHVLFAAPEVSLPDFVARWEAAHRHALAQAPQAAAALRRTVHQRQLPEFNPMLAYFGGLPEHPEGVASHWFDTPAHLGAFRAYEAAFQAFNDVPGQRFFDPSRSFQLHATEWLVLERTER